MALQLLYSEVDIPFQEIFLSMIKSMKQLKDDKAVIVPIALYKDRRLYPVSGGNNLRRSHEIVKKALGLV